MKRITQSMKFDIEDWYVLTQRQRHAKKLPVTRFELAESMGIEVTQIDAVVHGWRLENPDFKHEQSEKEVKLEDFEDTTGDFDIKKYLNAHKKQIADDLIKACGNNNATALRLYNQLTGDLVERPEIEVNLGFNAKQIIHEQQRARQRAEDEGMVTVPAEPRILLEEVCQDTEQGETPDD